LPDVWTIEDAPRFDRLETNSTADVAIIGAGYSGLIAALDLVSRGVSVVVVEADAPGAGASGRNAGHFAPMMLGAKKTPDDVLKALGPVRGKRWNRRVAGSGRALAEIAAAIPCDMRPGYLCVSRTAAGFDRMRKGFAAWERYGGVFTSLDANEVASRVGTDRYAGGILLPEGGTLHPLKFVLGLAASVRADGGSVYGGTPATAIERHGHMWRVRTPRGHIDAAHVLVATGTDRPIFPEMAGTVYPVGCSIAATPPLSVSPMPGTHAFVDLDDRAIFSPATDAEHRLVVSALSEARHPALPAAARPAERRLTRTYPGFAPRFESLSSGTIGVTPDGLPRLFRLGDNLHALAGCNGFGLTLGIAAAREAAAMIGGTAEHDLALPILDPKALPGRNLLPWIMRTVAVPLMNRLG
jgi:sarcosine oxidase